jgi:DNA modification methylase
VSIRLLIGDCRETLRRLPAESVNCVITSPPYFGLRAYGTAPQVWGGAGGCEHVWGAALPERFARWGDDSTLSAKQQSNGGAAALVCGGGSQKQGATSIRQGRANVEAQVQRGMPAGQFCERCGAWRGELGLEPTVALFVEHLVDVFREVRCVLRADGVCWVNLGDSFAHGGNGSRDADLWPKQSRNNNGDRIQHAKKDPALKPKDLCLIPHRFAIAAQEDGWYLRSDVIWAKGNPMPEGVTDRPSKAHEHVFMLTKSDRYHYDADAVREPYAEATLPQNGQAYHGNGTKDYAAAGVQNPSDAKRRIIASMEKHGGRNLRDVWMINTQPFQARNVGIGDADHFAVMPEELVKRCLLAGCPEGGTALDPFGGTGTVGVVAVGCGRSAILCELNPDSARIARARCGLWIESEVSA